MNPRTHPRLFNALRAALCLAILSAVGVAAVVAEGLLNHAH